MKSTSTAVWRGDLKSGQGTISTSSSALRDVGYTFKTRFEGAEGTNPEELIAAAHAGCFSMALSMILGEGGHTPESIEAKATVTLGEEGDGFAVKSSHLDVTAVVPGISDEAFQEAAGKAKGGCPISKLLNAEIGLDATYEV